MADIEIKDKGGGKGRSKKLPTRVDFTPMVDLGFLLITFFMLATTLSKPQAMELNVPAKDEEDDSEKPVTKASKTLTLILGENDTLFYYLFPTGNEDEPETNFIDFSVPKNLEPIIYDRQNFVEKHFGDKEELVVLIKAMSSAKYKNMVNILDEMSITNVKRYALVDFLTVDSMIIYGLTEDDLKQ